MHVSLFPLRPVLTACCFDLKLVELKYYFQIFCPRTVDGNRVLLRSNSFNRNLQERQNFQPRINIMLNALSAF
jgi:hypothetical protein